ncbi:hypothetical protein CERZMDRAFT_35311 [Cercospora zeae-maydis SCOH1-5]|uniref:DUF159 domain protein n=1 Tax=Cercospora zeae-maydis SCOH1-5 TaxID=717836 RepID=A0A6A6FRH6_9PEZI|nr:hypothetical protein CERZMDRAFT_35311 [Cercospora zeae-maydis SCOH1-5]
MCGRYAMSWHPSRVRRHFAEQNMPVDDAPPDDDQRLRQSYNFAPSYHGLIYRADTAARNNGAGDNDGDSGQRGSKASPGKTTSAQTATKYKLQAAKWGLVPFWTKRQPDYGSQLKTVNCRDDSLIENRGMWNTMKQQKRCVVVAEGFYEWLKKNNGKEKIPHFTKRKDGRLMCLAGLWDMVQYEGSDEKLYTYTIITTDSNTQLRFLHDRMPVIFEPGSDELKMWLDPNLVGWNQELQSMLKPYQGELECYPVDQAVGKVGNNSPQFIIPVNSSENKKNIANFFGNEKANTKDMAAKTAAARSQEKADETKHEDEDRSTTFKVETTEDNAPLPKSKEESERDLSQKIKADTAELDDKDMLKTADEQHSTPSPAKSTAGKGTNGRKPRSATSNNTVAKPPEKNANAKITSFFGGK